MLSILWIIPLLGIFEFFLLSKFASCFCDFFWRSFNLVDDSQDRKLLEILLETCINEDVLTTNRYKFSGSNDYFVPNKTLYRDYVEFLKVSNN